MNLKEKIKKILNEIIKDSNVYLVDIIEQHGGKIVIEIDSDKGITINECASIHRKIKKELNNIDLIVSSPGINSAFKIKKQYLKNINKKIQVSTFDNKILKGKLKNVHDEYIILETFDKKAHNIKIYFNDIKQAKSILEF